MSEKDFLNHLMEENKKPESFQEEKREKIIKEKKPLNKLYLLIGAFVFFIVLFLIYFFLFRAKIKMEDFVNKPKKELTSFLRQQDIEPNGVVFKEEYSLEVDKDLIISQSVAAGSYIKRNTKMNFVVSLGPNPEDSIKVPSDLKNMTRDQIKKWIDDNKAINARINLVYDDNVAENKVIKIESEKLDNYQRKDSLVVTISKGKAPAKTVVVPDFKNVAIDEYEALLKSKKLLINKVARNSDEEKYVKNSVISVSPEVNKEVKEGDTITVVYSAGKAVVVPNLKAMSKNEVNNWITENANYVIKNEVYSDQFNYVVSQSVSAGTNLKDNEKVTITLSKGMPKLSVVAGGEIIGMRFSELREKIDAIRDEGYDIDVGEWGNKRHYVKGYDEGKIVAYRCNIHNTGEIIDCDNPLPNNSRIGLTVSAGNIYDISCSASSTKPDSSNGSDETARSNTKPLATSNSACKPSVLAQNLSQNKIDYNAASKDLDSYTVIEIRHPEHPTKTVTISTIETIEIYENSVVTFK